MINSLRKILMVFAALLLALLGSGVLQPAMQAQAAAVTPGMSVVLWSRGSTYTTWIDLGAQFTFQARVQNTGNASLELVANLDVPGGWDLNEKYDDCPPSLDAGLNCTFTWVFTPHVSGSNYLRVYMRGLYTDSSGSASRITQSPAFLLNVRSAAQVQVQESSSSSGSSSASSTGGTTSGNPRLHVTLEANNLYTYAATIYAEKSLIFRARVQNTGNIPLRVVANLSVPEDWNVDQASYNDCPDSLAPNDTCKVSWYFTPRTAGEIFLRVVTKGFYTTSSGDTYRISVSPAFIFHVKPPKG